MKAEPESRIMGSRYSVLLYHGVHEDGLALEGRNGFGKHVSARRFESEIAWIAANRSIVTMREIADAHSGLTELPDNAVAVTFDDGFRNNLDTALPILERHGVPATIYIATGYIGTGRMIWTDRLEDAFLGSACPALDAEIAGARLRHTLDSRQARVEAFLEVKAWCKTLQEPELEPAVDGIIHALEHEPSADSLLYAFLDWDQVRKLSNSDVIDIGAHTIDHVSLARVPEDEMRRQIDQSIETVAIKLDAPCTLFSYPEGTERGHDQRVIDHLRSIGIDHAPSAIEGDNEIGVTDPFHIRRHLVGVEGRPMPLMNPPNEAHQA